MIFKWFLAFSLFEFILFLYNIHKSKIEIDNKLDQSIMKLQWSSSTYMYFIVSEMRGFNACPLLFKLDQ